MTQASITQAFVRPQRTSHYTFAHDGYRVTCLSGKQTGDHGVITIQDVNQQPQRATDLERTLVDVDSSAGLRGWATIGPVRVRAVASSDCP